MSPELKAELIKRAKSFGWRAGCMVGILLLSYVAEALKLFNLPEMVSVVLGLLIAEATKYLRNNTELLGRRLK